MNIPHPIPYQGSKRHLASSILEWFPDNTACLIEPFAGSAALSLAAARRGKARQFVLNDINMPLVGLWDAIIHRPAWIAQLYERLWTMQSGRERHFYDLVRARFNRTQAPYYLLYLLARCVKASVRYNQLGEFNQSPDNRRKGKHPQAMRGEIEGASRLLQGLTALRSGDYRQVLAAAGEYDLVYLDPPYQGVSTQRDSRYLRRIVFDEFVSELAALNRRGIAFIVSYDGLSGNKRYGRELPSSLGLEHHLLNVGRSTQATLLGRSDVTIESIYLSAALIERLENRTAHKASVQIALF
jgi:DNA adenine methylase